MRTIQREWRFFAGWKMDLEKVAAHETFAQFLRLYM